MSNTSFRKEILEAQIFSSIVRIKSDDFVLQVIFHNGFIMLKNFLASNFSFEWIKPDVFCKVINKDYIVFEAIRRHNWRRPYIRKDNLKRVCKDK